MPSGFYITEKSIKELERRCDRLIGELHKEEKDILLDAAQYIRDGIKQNIARQFKKRTGNLARSPYAIAYPPTMTKMAVAFAGIRPRKAPHAHLLENGTVNMAPHPFVRPAIDEREGPAVDMIQARLGKTIEGAL
jgi:HK97 gp10 family phage protein